MPEALDETLVEFPDNRLLIELCGQYDRHLAALEQGFGVIIMRRGNRLVLHGPADQRTRAAEALEGLYARLEHGRAVEQGDVDAAIRLGGTPGATVGATLGGTLGGTSGSTSGDTPGGAAAELAEAEPQLDMFPGGRMEIRTRRRVIEPRSNTQAAYVLELFRRELVFGLGPAGTGKTYLAVAAAVSMFYEQRVDRIILSRPAVEAGERLGFLPGDMREKIDPYLRPLYDALDDMIPTKQLARLMEEGKVEVAPLAFMRGRTLANAFVVLDEAQNTTEMQMKMFLTRLGEGSRMAVTGDPSQIDLPRGMGSGLLEAMRVLESVDEIGFVRFSSADVVRHPLVTRIVDAYEAAGSKAR